MRLHPGIRINRIPLAGGGGLIVALTLPLLILVAVPAIRPLAAVCVVGGVLFAVAVRALRALRGGHPGRSLTLRPRQGHSRVEMTVIP